MILMRYGNRLRGGGGNFTLEQGGIISFEIK